MRGITNFSRGEMGTLIAAELYRRGFATHIVSGLSEHQPVAYSSMVAAKTPAEMGEQAQLLLQSHPDAALVMVAAVLDFVPDKTVEGKISSQQQELNVRLVPVPKLIQTLQPRSQVKVVFKQPAVFDPKQDVRATIGAYFDPDQKTRASLLVVNPQAAMTAGNYCAYLFSPNFSSTYADSKQKVARLVSQHIGAKLGRKKNKMHKK